MAISNLLSNLANDDFTISKPSTTVPFSPISVSGTSLIDQVSDNSALPIETVLGIQREQDNAGRPTSQREQSEVYENETIVDFLTNAANAKVSGRVRNPLSFLASYTYQLSLYMISPPAYEAFVASGRRNIDIFNKADNGNNSSGAYLVAQSGGTGSQENRPDSMKYDYFIDKLSIETIAPARAESRNSVNINFKFSIIEPYGFSFISELTRAQKKLRNNSRNKLNKTSDETEQQDSTRNFFILGIRFYGWDDQGKVMLGNEIMPDGQPLDPNASGTGALFETFTELVFSSFKFKIDGRSTVYNIEGQPTAIGNAINVRRGMITSSKEVYGNTVGEMLLGKQGLLKQINEEQKKLEAAGTVGKAVTYKIKWLGAQDIRNSSVITDNINDKTNQANRNVNEVDDSNPAAELSATPDSNTRKMSFGKIPIVQAIEQIIGRSRYIQDALTKNYTDDKQIDPDTNIPDSKEGKNKELKWFNISPEITNIKWDEQLNDWSYDITYVIKPYLIPNVAAPYVNVTSKYYGPHKRYDYWYTGKNTEILAYEQTINNNYFLATLSDDGSSQAKVAPVGTDMEAGGDKTGDKGTSSGASLNAFRTSLYDPGSFVQAKFQILGDPDYLMNSTVSSIIGPRDENGKPDITSRQIFFEVDFREARDYNEGKEDIKLLEESGTGGITGQPGTMALNDSIEFWKYDNVESATKINGVSYQLIKVKSNFNNGSFTQYIESVINRALAPDALTDDAITEIETESDIDPVQVDADGNPIDLTENGNLPGG